MPESPSESAFSCPPSLADVVHTELLRGAEAPPEATPELLIEVPHGADERRHYDRLRAELVGADLPAELEVFFHVNTDVGAWAYGRATAEAVLAAAPRRSALLVRSLIPRTFIDCNRPADRGGGGDLTKGGVTAGIPSYVRDERDLALLTARHAEYVATAEAAYQAVCGRGGVALVPHTYGPRTVGIERVDDDIVRSLRWACEPDRFPTWPERAEVDLLTRDAEGQDLSPPGLEAELLAAFQAAGFAPRANDAYNLHPATLGHTWAAAYPGQTLCLEVRRDLLVAAWTPFQEMTATSAATARIAAVLAPALEGALRARGL